MNQLDSISSSMGLGLRSDGLGTSSLLSGGNSVDEHRAFEEVLGVARQANPNATEQERADEAREAAEKLVATTFLEPLLKSVRESNHAAAPFAPTQAEKQFRGLMDARVAETVVRRSHMPIVERIANDLMRAGGVS